MSLSESLKDEGKQAAVVAEAVKLVDEEVAGKSGLSGFAVKKGYDAVKSLKPGFITEVVKKLLPDFAGKLEPIWEEGKKGGAPTRFMQDNKSRVAEALLSVTDSKIDTAKSSVVRSTYSMLRGSAKKHVEDAVPRLSKLVEKYDA
jgi:hypothetical protein